MLAFRLKTPLLPTERWTVIALAALTVVRVVVAAVTPISPDEAYYWLWSRPVQLSYYDHPGMAAWWLWASTGLFGNTAFAVRLPALIAALVVSVVIWDTARSTWSDRRSAARATLWLNATLMFGAVGILMTPDVPMVLFWSMALWGVVRLDIEGRARWLYVIGVAFGLGMISKYTMGLLAPGMLIVFLAFRSLRRWFLSYHLWLAFALCVACTTPAILWNQRHGWASVAKQFGHAFASGVDDPFANLGTFLGGQFGMATPIIFVFVICATAWALFDAIAEKRPDWFLLALSSLPIIVFFTIHALSNVVQAHWPGPAYLGGAILAAGAPMVAAPRTPLRQLLVMAAPVLGIVMTALVYLQATTAVFPLPARIDATKRLGGWTELADAVAAARKAHPDAFMLVTKHETAGLMSFYLPGHPVAFQIGGQIRPSFYDEAAVAALKGRDALLISAAHDGDMSYLAPHFMRLTQLSTVTLHWGGRDADEYRVTLAEGYRGGLIVQGDGYPGAIDKP